MESRDFESSCPLRHEIKATENLTIICCKSIDIHETAFLGHFFNRLNLCDTTIKMSKNQKKRFQYHKTLKAEPSSRLDLLSKWNCNIFDILQNISRDFKSRTIVIQCPPLNCGSRIIESATYCIQIVLFPLYLNSTQNMSVN